MLGKIASDHVAMLISAIAYMCLDQNRTKCVFGHSPFLFCFISLFPHIRISHLLEHVSIYVWKTTIVIKLKSFDMGISCAYYCTHLNIIYIYIYIYMYQMAITNWTEIINTYSISILIQHVAALVCTNSPIVADMFQRGQVNLRFIFSDQRRPMIYMTI